MATLSKAYGGDVNKVEPWIGGLAEDPADGALVGPTFQAIVAKQFSALRDGDPHWFQTAPISRRNRSAPSRAQPFPT